MNYSVFGEIKLFENNVNNIVKRVNIQNSNISELDVSALLNLKRLNLEYNQLKNLDLSNNVLLTEFDGSYNNLEDINLEKNVNLSYLDLAHNNFSKINIKNNMLLKNLYLNYNKLEEVDFSNNNNLETLRYDENKNIKKIIGTKNIPLDGEYVFDFPYLEEIDLTGCENIPMLGILSNELKSLDLTDMKNLVLLLTTSQKIEEIKGIEGAQQLATLFLPYTKIDSLDLSSLSNLQTLNAQYTNLSRNSINMLSGENKKLNLKLKLPQQMTLEHYNEDDYFAEYNIENNLITANNPGQTVITSYFPSYHFYLDVLSKEGIKTTVNVFDINSSKFLINKEYKYIFDENNESSKVLNRYIKVYGEDVSKEIENNKLFMYSNDKKIFTFDILKITSEDYKIDNKKNVITYSGTFDINKISVVNGTLNKIDNELQLICNDNIVRTYKLEKK